MLPRTTTPWLGILFLFFLFSATATPSSCFPEKDVVTLPESFDLHELSARAVVENKLAYIVQILSDYYEDGYMGVTLDQLGEYISDDHFQYARFLFPNGTVRFQFLDKATWVNSGFPMFRDRFKFLEDNIHLTAIYPVEKRHGKPSVMETKSDVINMFQYDVTAPPQFLPIVNATTEQAAHLTIRWCKDDDGSWRICRFTNVTYHRRFYPEGIAPVQEFYEGS